MVKRHIGIGTLSLLLIALGFVWGFTLFGICVGDVVLQYMGAKAWSNGNTGIHYTIYYMLIFFIPAFVIAKKYENDLGAKIGKRLSVVSGIILIVSTFWLSV